MDTTHNIPEIDTAMAPLSPELLAQSATDAEELIFITTDEAGEEYDNDGVVSEMELA